MSLGPLAASVPTSYHCRRHGVLPSTSASHVPIGQAFMANQGFCPGPPHHTPVYVELLEPTRLMLHTFPSHLNTLPFPLVPTVYTSAAEQPHISVMVEATESVGAARTLF